MSTLVGSTLGLLLAAAAGQASVAPAARASIVSLSAQCAKDPSQFHAALLSEDQLESYMTPHSSDLVKGFGRGDSFELSGRCDATLRSLVNGIRLAGGQLLTTNWPPFELAVVRDADATADNSVPAPAPIPSAIRQLSLTAPTIPGPLTFRQAADVPGFGIVGLWSNARGSMIAVTRCPTADDCLRPRVVAVSRHPMTDLSWQPLPDGRRSTSVRFWLHIGRLHDARINLILLSA